MLCDNARQLMAASWANSLPAVQIAELQEHLDGCPECAGEMSELSAVWLRLGELPDPEPSAALDARWKATLNSQIRKEHRVNGRMKFWMHPAWQAAAAAACVAIGVLIGLHWQRDGGDREQIAQLRTEVANTKAMVALSLLEQQSAVERLRGIDYSAQLSPTNSEIVSALIQTVNRDPNVNVRLAAIDALSKVSSDHRVVESMAQSLGQQESPLVQATIIDYLVDARAGNSITALKRFEDRQELNPDVKQRAASALRQLALYQ